MRTSSISVIGGADGPTSVFIAGRKEKNLLRRIRRAVYDRKYRRKRKTAERSIVPGAHTIQETLRYVEERYGIVEVDSTYRNYEMRKQERKHNLIYRKKPELLSEEKRIPPLEDFHDIKAVQAWEKEIQEWAAMREKEIAAISEEDFPTDYHLFVADRGAHGRVEMEVDLLQEEIVVSYSGGDKKTMKSIIKDIYQYFGVSQEDIARHTARYQDLLAVLSM